MKCFEVVTSQLPNVQLLLIAFLYTVVLFRIHYFSTHQTNSLKRCIVWYFEFVNQMLAGMVSSAK